jgi:predicted ATPase
MVGRHDAVADISAQVLENRFVTIAGPGGLGKTTVAVSVAHRLLEEFGGAICFADLGTLNDPRLVPGAVASLLGLAVRSDDPTPSLINYMRDRRMLLILDSCEHVIETAAALAERVFAAAPHLHILATSRELLRVEGEHVHRLAPLNTPPADIDVSMQAALDFPSVQLFVERVTAGGRSLDLNDNSAKLIAEICRRLDGIALAIELAAARALSCSIPETLDLLNNRLRSLSEGRRTALPRHQTLSATLDWSYDLLSDEEQLSFRRLSVFAGSFDLSAVAGVIAEETGDEEVINTLASLIEKSMVAVGGGAVETNYRLLDTTRAYAASKLTASGELATIKRRHADYYCALLQKAQPIAQNAPMSGNPRRYAEQLDDVRAALEWSFSDDGELATGIALAAGAAHVFLETSRLTECCRWSEAALAALDEVDRGTRREMDLQAALGKSLMLAKGNSDEARCRLSRALELAENLGYLRGQLLLLGHLTIFDHRAGNCQEAFALAERSGIVAASIGDMASNAEANWCLGFSNYFAGNQREAEANWSTALAEKDDADHGIDPDTWTRMRCGLVAVRWLRGFPDQSAELANETIKDGTSFRDPSTLCIGLIFAGNAFLRMGRWTTALQAIDRIISHATRYSLPPFEAIGLAMKGMYLIRQDEATVGVELLRGALDSLHAGRYELHNPVFLSALAEGLAMSWRFDAALTAIDDAMLRVERNGQLFSLPEFLRIKGEILISAARSDVSEPERLFLRSLELAGRQSALSWQLRTATSLARLWSGQGRSVEAANALGPIYAGFTEGFETPDLQEARRLLDHLQEGVSPDGWRKDRSAA